jgi:uncharacterized membrane protein
MPKLGHTDKLTWLSRALSLTGLAISSYLAVTYLRHQAPVCLAGSRGCLKVEQSSYARPAGIPLPLLGVAGYLMLFITACMRGQRARTVGMVLTMFAITTSLCLTYLELGVIHALCYWCVSSAICAGLHVIVNSTRYVRGDPGTDQRRDPGDGRGDKRAASRWESDGGRCQRRGSRSAPHSAQPAA